MKKIMLAVIFPWLSAIFGQQAFAQDTMQTGISKETQEIVIRKKGNKDITLNLQITGDKVIVNGKPLIEFNDDAITINKRKIVINTDKWGEDISSMFNDMSMNFQSVPGMENGKSRPFLGVFTEKNEDGAKIIIVSKESAAEAAGLLKDDIITKINGTKVTGPDDLYSIISKSKPGDEIKVAYKRGSSREKTLKVTLRETKSNSAEPFKSLIFTSPDGSIKTLGFPPAPQMREDLRRDWERSNNDIAITGFRKQRLGIKIQDLEEGEGVKILSVDDASPAATAGIKEGDVLTEVNGKKITNTDDARISLQDNMESNNYPLKAKRNGTEMIFTIKIPKKLKTANL